MKSILHSSFVSIVIACFLTQGNLAAQIPQSALDAQEVLKQHCYKCHGENGVAVAGLNVLNWRQLVGESAYVVPNKPDESVLFSYIESGEMPPKEDSPKNAKRPSERELDILEMWIRDGAPTFEVNLNRKFITTEQVYEAIRADLDSGMISSATSTRYIVLHHLYNAGLPDDQLATYRIAISKLINSLSWHPKISIPVPIDTEQTIYRIDLSDYLMSTRQSENSQDVWELIKSYNPYNIEHSSSNARYVYENLGDKMPFVHGDWLVATASKPPLYYEILEIPKSEIELERRLRVNVKKNISTALVLRAGFVNSGVSDNNRVIERHSSQYGAYWKSYDFSENKGKQLVTKYPLGPDIGSNSFKHEGGEIIFNLPNGLQAYMLSDSKGKRIDKGPIEIVNDPHDTARNGGAIVAGISCMNCHDQGIIPKKDEIRDFVVSNRDTFINRGDQFARILGLYGKHAELNRFYREDSRRHQSAAYQAGVPAARNPKTGRPELVDGKSIVRLSHIFGGELDIRRAAADVGVGEETFLGLLDHHELATNLGILKVDGKTIKRETFIASLPELISKIGTGRYISPTQKLILPMVPAPNNSDLSGLWRNYKTETTFRYKQKGNVLTVELEGSETMSFFSASFRITGDRLVSTAYSCKIKGDPRSTLYRRSATGRIVDDSSIEMRYPFIFINRDGSIRSQGWQTATYLRVE